MCVYVGMCVHVFANMCHMYVYINVLAFLYGTLC